MYTFPTTPQTLYPGLRLVVVYLVYAGVGVRGRFLLVVGRVASGRLYVGENERRKARLARITPEEVKFELGHVRAGTQAFAAPCSDRQLQGATGALCLVFVFFASNSGCQMHLFGRVVAKRASQPRVKFGASAGVLVDAPDGHKSLVIERRLLRCEFIQSVTPVM